MAIALLPLDIKTIPPSLPPSLPSSLPYLEVLQDHLNDHQTLPSSLRALRRGGGRGRGGGGGRGSSSSFPSGSGGGTATHLSFSLEFLPYRLWGVVYVQGEEDEAEGDPAFLSF
jgi:hypothetical protein